ncbi:MAG: hypothetical protein Q9220_005545 [cf. Caloplaca sp. 1 TL-2023]
MYTPLILLTFPLLTPLTLAAYPPLTGPSPSPAANTVVVDNSNGYHPLSSNWVTAPACFDAVSDLCNHFATPSSSLNYNAWTWATGAKGCQVGMWLVPSPSAPLPTMEECNSTILEPMRNIIEGVVQGDTNYNRGSVNIAIGEFPSGAGTKPVTTGVQVDSGSHSWIMQP